MNPDCERWTKLSDQDAVGQPLPEEAREFLLSHARACDECSREAAVFRGLLAPEVSEAGPSEREVDDVLVRAGEATAAAAERRTRQRRWAAGVVATLAAAAGVALWSGSRDDNRMADARARAGAVDVPAVTPAPPKAAVPASPPTGAGCSELLPGVLACTAAHTAITRRDLDSKARFVELERGHIVISLSPQPSGTSFSVVTAAGHVTAVGTVFSVEIGEDGAVVARVVEGKVVVREKDAAASRPLRAGESLRLGESKPSALTADERERELSLLPPEVRGALSADTAAPAPAALSSTAATPEALLKQALSLRAQGQFRRAAEIYRKIHQTSPTSVAGGTALVSLGELSLSSLNDPRAALAAFDSYLSRGGALSQEAAFGRIRALRALGRTAEERGAIERFVAQYPGAPQSRILRERLATLDR